MVDSHERSRLLRQEKAARRFTKQDRLKCSYICLGGLSTKQPASRMVRQEIPAVGPTYWFSFTCKSRHARCDEKKPVCTNCERLKLQCRASEFITMSAWCAVVESSPPQREKESVSFNNSDGRVGPTAGNSPTSTWDIFNSRITCASSDEPIQTSSFSPDSSSALTGTSTPSAVTLTAETAYLLHAYQDQSGVARWMDLFDHEATYQRAVVRRVLRSELLLRCVCAFTAKHLSLLESGGIWKEAAARYYGESLGMLIKLLGGGGPQDDALTATMLLCSFEMIAAQGSEHRRHFFGAMLLITTHGINASSVGINRANFWVYVRHEIVVALVNESSLLLSLDMWNVSWREDETEEDVLGNQVLWLLGRAVNLTYAKNPRTGEPMGTVTERRELSRDTEMWFDKLPVGFQGVKYGDETDDGLSQLYFAVPAAGKSLKNHSDFERCNDLVPNLSCRDVAISPDLHTSIR